MKINWKLLLIIILVNIICSLIFVILGALHVSINDFGIGLIYLFFPVFMLIEVIDIDVDGLILAFLVFVLSITVNYFYYPIAYKSIYRLFSKLKELAEKENN